MMIEGAGRGAVSPRIKVAHEHDYIVNNCDVDAHQESLSVVWLELQTNAARIGGSLRS